MGTPEDVATEKYFTSPTEAKDILKQIALEIFGTNDGIRPRFPHTGEKIQEAMEISFKAGIKEMLKWVKSHSLTHKQIDTKTLQSADRFADVYEIYPEGLQLKLKEWGIE